MTTDHYWSIDFPGLSGADAHRVCEIVRESGMAYRGILADPEVFMTLHMDRPTVELLVKALAGSATDAGAQALHEQLNAWLTATDPVGS